MQHFWYPDERILLSRGQSSPSPFPKQGPGFLAGHGTHPPALQDRGQTNVSAFGKPWPSIISSLK